MKPQVTFYVSMSHGVMPSWMTQWEGGYVHSERVTEEDCYPKMGWHPCGQLLYYQRLSYIEEVTWSYESICHDAPPTVAHSTKRKTVSSFVI